MKRLVLLHGFSHTGASWKPVMATVGESYRAVALDLRGHGAASPREPVLEGVVEDVLAAVEGRFDLVGYSMGGRLALHVALTCPERVSSLVLIGASPGIASDVEREARREADERLAAEIEGLGIEEVASRWSRLPVLKGQPDWIHADRLRNTPAGLARALRGLGTGALPSLWDRLGELSMPVTVVVGERDQKFREVASEMVPRIARAEVVVVPGAGHAVHLESPEAVAAIIVRRNRRITPETTA